MHISILLAKKEKKMSDHRTATPSKPSIRSSSTTIPSTIPLHKLYAPYRLTRRLSTTTDDHRLSLPRVDTVKSSPQNAKRDSNGFESSPHISPEKSTANGKSTPQKSDLNFISFWSTNMRSRGTQTSMRELQNMK